MKTGTFVFWISLLVLFPQGLFSKSPTDREQYISDRESLNDNSDVDLGNNDVAVHDHFRHRHKSHKHGGKHPRFYRSESESSKDQEITPQCAVMYKDNEPVGILQPYKESYRFLPVSGDPTLVDINPVPAKRKTIMDVLYPKKINEDYNEEFTDNANQFADDRYPSIFAKFKIDSRLGRNIDSDIGMKRSMNKRDTEKPEISDEPVSSLKTTQSKMKNDNSAVVEEKLKNILDDMGLIEDYDDKEEAKREVEEDENLEQGTNKINLIKEEHNETRNKRGGTTTDETAVPATTEHNAITALAIPTTVKFIEEHTEDAESIDLFKDGEVKLNDDLKKEDSTEIESEESRKKREFEEEHNKKDNKREADVTDSTAYLRLTTSDLVSESELNEYEKRIEREIRDKILKLKEEVREEIKNLNNNQKSNQHNESDSKRRKRQVINTLIDEETQNIDPNLNDVEEHREHHIRRKRSLDNFGSLNETSENTLNSSSIVKIDVKDLTPNINEEINEDKDGLRFIINFGSFDKMTNAVNWIGEDYEQQKEKNDTEKEVPNNNTAVSLTELNETVSETDTNISPVSSQSFTISDIEQDNNKKLETGNSTTHNIPCKVRSCSICKFNKRKQKTKINKGLKRKRDNLETQPHSSNITSNLTNTTNPDDKKKNITDILTVIRKKKHVELLPEERNASSINDSTSITEVTPTNKFTSSKQDVNVLSNYTINGTNENDKTNYTSRYYSTQFKLDDVDSVGKNLVDNIEEINNNGELERVIGINKFLTNITNSSNNSDDRSLDNTDHMRAKRETAKENATIDIHLDHKIVEQMNNTSKTKRFVGINPILERITNFPYHSRNLKQINEDMNTQNSDQPIHVRVKRDEGTNIENVSIRNLRTKREASSEDLEENAYNYDDAEFSEDASNENRVDDDQSYAIDNSDEKFTSNLKSNCNCDKSNPDCKCGSQKNDASVPNVKDEYYADYEEGPPSYLEKKSTKHCNCDKNGKQCKCQTIGQGSQYPDYADDQSKDLEKEPADVEADSVLEDVEPWSGAAERVPRCSTQRRWRTMDNNDDKSNVEDSAEEYYENYETEGNRLVKRETKARKLTENQQFQNGEYFVDLHPNVYRLTRVDTPREKRDFNDLVSLHGGGPVVNHLVAIKQRSMLPHSRFRRRVINDDNKELRQLIDMSDEDLFGALPQSFAGELTRYKRVKRGRNKK